MNSCTETLVVITTKATDITLQGILIWELFFPFGSSFEIFIKAFSQICSINWHNIKATYMDLAYRNDLWAACAATRSHYTDDGFIDFLF